MFGAPGAEGDRQLEPRGVLRACCSGSAVLLGVPIGFAFGTATLAFLACVTRVPLTHRRLAHGRGHEQPRAARGAAVRVPRPADRDDRHGARDGGVPRLPARPCARRPLLRAARRDVSRLRHFRLEGRRHGGDRAGAVSRDEAARQPRGRADRDPRGVRRDERDDPAEPRADHHRLGHRRLDRGPVHRRVAARRGARARARAWSRGGARAASTRGERASRRA